LSVLAEISSPRVGRSRYSPVRNTILLNESDFSAKSTATCEALLIEIENFPVVALASILKFGQ
jgi:hypothetical protein